MRIQLLGPVAWGPEPSAPRTVPGAVAAGLLAHLTLASGRVLSWPALAERVWEEPPASARNAIQVAVSKLRKASEGDGETGLIESGARGYRLRTDLVRVDWHEADQLVASARRQLEVDDAAGAARDARVALDLFHGEPLAGLDTAAAEAARSAGNALRCRAALVLGAALVRGRRADEAVAVLSDLATEAPFDEAVLRALMEALTVAGRPADALRVYEDLRRRLADELGTDPAPETAELFGAVLRGEASGAAGGRDARAVTDTSTVRAGPTHRPAGLGARTLPAEAGPLIGRDEDVDEVLAALAGGRRLVTLHGPGGLGKTRTAVAAAKRLGRQHGSDAFFVDLVPCHDTATVLSALVAATSAAGGEMADVCERLAHRPATVVLDNAEHVLGPVLALVPELLGVDETRLIVTSRTPLHLRDELVIALRPLGCDSEDSAAVEMLRYLAPSQPAEALLPLARRADGVPLVLELMAAALRWRSASDLLRQLANGLEELTDDAQDRPARHQDVHEVLRWGLQQASDAAARALRTLTVLQGPFTLATVVAVLGPTQPEAPPRALLAELVDLALVQRVPEPGEPRFRILEPVRDSIAAVLGEDVGEGARRAHAEHFFGELQRLEGDADLVEGAWAFAKREEANILAALRWAWDADRPLAMSALANALLSWQFMGGHEPLAAEWAGRALDDDEPSAATAAVALAYWEFTDTSNDYAYGNELLDMTDRVADQLEGRWRTLWALRHAYRAFRDGDADALGRWVGQFPAPDGARDVVLLRTAATWPLLLAGELDLAANRFEEIVAMPAVRATATTLVSRLSDLGYLLSLVGRYDEALQALEESSRVAAENGLLDTFTRLNLVWLFHLKGEPRAVLHHAATYVAEHPTLSRRAYDLIRIGAVGALALFELGQPRDAARLGRYVVQAYQQQPSGYDPEERRELERLVVLMQQHDGVGPVTEADAVEVLRRAGAAQPQT